MKVFRISPEKIFRIWYIFQIIRLVFNSVSITPQLSKKQIKSFIKFIKKTEKMIKTINASTILYCFRHITKFTTWKGLEPWHSESCQFATEVIHNHNYNLECQGSSPIQVGNLISWFLHVLFNVGSCAITHCSAN